MKGENCCRIHRLADTPRRWRPNDKREWLQVSDPTLKTLRRVCCGHEPWPLVLTGDVGSGKTCLSLLLLDIYGTFYYTAADWCARVRVAQMGQLQTSNGYPLSEKEVWDEWERANLVVLDELGARSEPSDFQRETIQRAIDARKARPAVFISNLGLMDLAAVYDGRIASRLGAGTVLHLRGDKRLA